MENFVQALLIISVSMNDYIKYTVLLGTFSQEGMLWEDHQIS